LDGEKVEAAMSVQRLRNTPHWAISLRDGVAHGVGVAKNGWSGPANSC